VVPSHKDQVNDKVTYTMHLFLCYTSMNNDSYNCCVIPWLIYLQHLCNT